MYTQKNVPSLFPSHPKEKQKPSGNSAVSMKPLLSAKCRHTWMASKRMSGTSQAQTLQSPLVVCLGFTLRFHLSIKANVELILLKNLGNTEYNGFSVKNMEP